MILDNAGRLVIESENSQVPRAVPASFEWNFAVETAEMAEDKEPSGGLTLFEAFHAYANPEKVRAAHAARDGASNVRNVVARRDSFNRLVYDRNNPALRKAESRSDQARREAIRDFWERFVSGELFAWGAEGSPTINRSPIPKRAWRYLWPANWETSVLKGPEGLRIYAVLVYEALHESASGSQSITNAISENEAADLPTGHTAHDAEYSTVHQRKKPDEASARSWLQELVDEYPERQPRRKDDLRKEAMRKFGVTGKGFDNRVWERELSPDHPWRKAGPLPKK